MVMEESLPEEHFLKKIENVMQDSDEEYENMTEAEKRQLIRTGMSEEERSFLKGVVSAAFPDLKRQHEEQHEEYMPVYADPKMQQEHLEMKKRLFPPEEVERLKQRLMPPEDLERLKNIEKEMQLKAIRDESELKLKEMIKLIKAAPTEEDRQEMQHMAEARIPMVGMWREAWSTPRDVEWALKIQMMYLQNYLMEETWNRFTTYGVETQLQGMEDTCMESQDDTYLEDTSLEDTSLQPKLKRLKSTYF